MVFYFLLPKLYSKIKNLKSALLYFVAFLLLSVVLKYGIIAIARIFFGEIISGAWFLYYWLPSQLPVFLLGIICYFLIKNNYHFSRGSNYFIQFIAFFWLIISVFLCQYYLFLPEHILISLSFCALVYTLSQFKFTLFENYFTKFLGKISFSLYLSHFFIIDFLHEKIISLDYSPFLSLILLYFCVLTTGALLSYLLYTVIEKQGIIFGKNIIKRYEAKINLRSQ